MDRSRRSAGFPTSLRVALGWIVIGSLLPAVSRIEAAVCEDAPSVTLPDRCLGMGLCPSASGGAGPYTWLWSTGATTICIVPVEAGTYTVTATDQLGCTGTATATVFDSPSVVLSDAEPGESTCATVSGGTPPYAYSWSDGSTAECSDPVCPGRYTVTVTDAHGCTGTGTITVTGTLAVSVADACPGDTLCASVSGGTPPYSYTWTGGSTTACITPFCPGTYTVTVTDALGCSVFDAGVLCRPVLRVPSEFATLQDAVDCLAPGDTVLVAPGTYAGPGNAGLVLDKPIMLLSEGGSAATVVDCEGSGYGITVPAGVSGVVVDGFTVQDAGEQGMFLQSGSSATVRNCVVSGSLKAGVRLFTATADFTDCEIVNNTGSPGSSASGGINAGSLSTLTLLRCRISGNTGGGAGGPGGVHIRDSSLDMDDCEVSGNSGGGGGGIGLHYTSSSSGALVAIDDSRIVGNTATGHGGGLATDDMPITVNSCLITGNDAQGNGGGVYKSETGSQGLSDFRGCTISGNHAGGKGGGIYSAGGWVTRSIVWGNCADSGSHEAHSLYLGIAFGCSAVDSSEVGADGFASYFDPSCIFVDPQFCSAVHCSGAPTDAGTYELAAGSPCLPGASPCGALIGSRGECSGAVGVEDPEPTARGGFFLFPPSPNPFRGGTLVRFRLAEPSPVLMDVFDVRGRRVERLLDDPMRPAGVHEVRWRGTTGRGNRAPGGIYFLRLVTRTESASRRVVVLQ